MNSRRASRSRSNSTPLSAVGGGGAGFEFRVRPRERHDQAGVIGIQLVPESPVAADIELVRPAVDGRSTGADLPDGAARILPRAVVPVIRGVAVTAVTAVCAVTSVVPGTGAVVRSGRGMVVALTDGESGQERLAGFVDQDHAGAGLHIDPGRYESFAGPVPDGLNRPVAGVMSDGTLRRRGLRRQRGTATGEGQGEECGQRSPCRGSRAAGAPVVRPRAHFTP